jgi:hypothetical protein
MRRPLLVLLMAVLALAVSVSAASACINDRETNKAEREFKSTYEKAPAAPEYQPPPADNGKEKLITLGGGLGAGLLAGAVIIGLRRPK